MNRTWRRSSRCGENGSCVEVALTPEAVHVRDSTDPDGPVLSFPAAAWQQFVRTRKREKGPDRP